LNQWNHARKKQGVGFPSSETSGDICGRRTEDCPCNPGEDASPVPAEAAEGSDWELTGAAGVAATSPLRPPHRDGRRASSPGAAPWHPQRERGFPGMAGGGKTSP